MLDRFKARDPEPVRELASPRPPRPARPRARRSSGRSSEYNRDDAGRRRSTIEPELVDAVLDQVATRKGRPRPAGRGVVDGGASARVTSRRPTCRSSWSGSGTAERESGSAVLRLRTLDALGGAEQIVRDHLDDALEALPPEEPGGGGRDVQPSRHAVRDEDRAPRLGPRGLRGRRPTASSSRCCRRSRPSASCDRSAATDGSTRYEIFHDVLADAVLAWRTPFTRGASSSTSGRKAASACVGVMIGAVASARPGDRRWSA